MNTINLNRNKPKSEMGLAGIIILATLGLGALGLGTLGLGYVIATDFTEGQSHRRFPTHIYNADDKILPKQPQIGNEFTRTIYIPDNSQPEGYKIIDILKIDTQKLTLSYR